MDPAEFDKHELELKTFLNNRSKNVPLIQIQKAWKVFLFFFSTFFNYLQEKL